VKNRCAGGTQTPPVTGINRLPQGSNRGDTYTFNYVFFSLIAQLSDAWSNSKIFPSTLNIVIRVIIRHFPPIVNIVLRTVAFSAEYNLVQVKKIVYKREIVGFHGRAAVKTAIFK
jgi:hypothetical protein